MKGVSSGHGLTMRIALVAATVAWWGCGDPGVEVLQALAACTPQWECTEWSGCGCDGYRVRSCEERSGCGFTEGRPEEREGCEPACGNGRCECGEGPGTCPADCPDWVRIPGGRYRMGSEGGESDERPVHWVEVGSFEMARTEVTVGQYRECVEAGVCTAPGTGGGCNWGVSGREDHPVNCVDWGQARVFSEWVGGRLPSEAEWEYAARSGGKGRVYPWGDEEATCDRVVMDDGSGDGCGRGSTWSVCSKALGNTEQGLCDMSGNVWEWVQDWYHGSYEGAPSDGSAWEVPAGQFRVYRGGSWNSVAGVVRAAGRGSVGPGCRYGYLGFRPARPVR